MRYTKELSLAKQLALDAGQVMLQYFRSDKIGTIWKNDDSPLTIADTAINELVIARIKASYPDHGIHGEELSVDEGRDLMWVCDPIDGTMPFSIGMPISVLSLALTYKGQPRLGVLYDPFCQRLYWAIKDGGAFLNDQPIKVSHQGIKNAYVGADAWATGNVVYPPVFVPLPHLRDLLLDAGVKPLTPSSAVMAGALTASGEMAGEIFGATKPEDIAALKVIVEDAGGKVTDLEGNDQRYDHSVNGAIVSNGIVHKQLLAIVQKSRAKTRPSPIFNNSISKATVS